MTECYAHIATIVVVTVCASLQLPSIRAASSGGRIRIDPVTGHFVDTVGRANIFHGVNVVHKRFPWHPSLGKFDAHNSLNAEDISNLASWGFNIVRLGIMWPGVEPSPGQYNTTYLKVMRQLVDDLYDAGIYTILDFHQDNISEKWCGEGLPYWLVEKLGPFRSACEGIVPWVAELWGQCKPFAHYNYSIDPSTGFPHTSECLSHVFTEYARCPEVMSAWGTFFASDTARQALIGYWKAVAFTFAGAKGVLAYGLFNEPPPGDVVGDLSELMPGVSDRTVLQPFYTEMHAAIKSMDPEAISMYEPTPVPDTFPSNVPFMGGVHPTGFTAGPAGKNDFNVTGHALSYHIYSCGFAAPTCNRKGDPPKDCPLCDDYAAATVSTRQKDATRLGGGIFLTEFGACSSSEQCVTEINRVAGFADTEFQSWAYWQFKYNQDDTTVSGPIEGFYLGNGSLQHQKVAALSRTYSYALAGKPVQMRYEASTGAFRLIYITEPATASQPTWIFLNKAFNYPDGHVISGLNTSRILDGQHDKNRVMVVSSGSGLKVDVAITRNHTGPRSGTIEIFGKRCLSWTLVDAQDHGGFQLAATSKSTWMEMMLKVYADDGKVICSVATKDEEVQVCKLMEEQQHELLFNYKIDVLVGHDHIVNVHTITSSTFGVLLRKKIEFQWHPFEDMASEFVV